MHPTNVSSGSCAVARRRATTCHSRRLGLRCPERTRSTEGQGGELPCATLAFVAKLLRCRATGGRAVAFVRAVTSAYGQYFQFSGRSTRSEFWFWFLFVMLAAASFATGAVLVSHLTGPSSQAANTALIFAFLIFWAGSLIPNYALIFRRLHDVGRSGWWFLVMAVPIVGLILLIYWLCQLGTDGSNQFGPAQP